MLAAAEPYLWEFAVKFGRLQLLIAKDIYEFLTVSRVPLTSAMPIHACRRDRISMFVRLSAYTKNQKYRFVCKIRTSCLSALKWA